MDICGERRQLGGVLRSFWLGLEGCEDVMRMGVELLNLVWPFAVFFWLWCRQTAVVGLVSLITVSVDGKKVTSLFGLIVPTVKILEFLLGYDFDF